MNGQAPIEQAQTDKSRKTNFTHAGSISGVGETVRNGPV